MIIDTTLRASDPVRFRKMTVADQIKMLDRKIMPNEAQYDLDRKVAKIFALYSNNLDKYEYLTGEDLDLRPSTVEQARFEHSPLGKFFNKVLKEEDRKEGLLKRLRDIEDKSEEQLKAIEDQKEIQTRIISKNEIKPPLLKSIYSQEVKDGRIDGYKAKRIFKTLEDMEGGKIDYSKLMYRSGDNDYFDLTEFGPLSSFYLKLINGSLGINIVKLKLKGFKIEIDSLKRKKAKKQSYRAKKRCLRKC